MNRDKGDRIPSYQSMTRDTLDSIQDFRYLIVFFWGEPRWVEALAAPPPYIMASSSLNAEDVFWDSFILQISWTQSMFFLQYFFRTVETEKGKKKEKKTHIWVTNLAHTGSFDRWRVESLFRAKLPTILKSKRETWRYFRGTVGL